MVQYSYQGVPASPPPPTIAIASGNLTSAKAGTWYFALQYRNLAGYSPVSTVVSGTIAASQKFTVTIPGLALPSPNGCQIWEYCLLASRNADFSNPSLIATYPGYDTDGTTVLSPPFAIVLDRDEHLELAKTVVSAASLPSGVNRLHGQRRFLDDPADLPNRMLAWNQYVSMWEPAFPQLFDTRVSSITGSNGALRDWSAIEDTRVIRVPGYSADPSIGMRPVGFWLTNNGNTVIPSGTRISFEVDINGEDVSTLPGIVGGLELKFLGYANVSTGVLDTSDMTIASDPIDYQGRVTGLTLQKDLQIGYAYCLTVRAKFTAIQLNGRVFQGASLGFSPEFFTDFSTYSPIDLFGSMIASRYKLRRVVPRTGLSALALKGSGTIEIPDGGSLSFNNVGAQVVPGLLANTANQNCIISVGGTCYVAATVPVGAELRCKLGTVNGAGSATSYNTTPITLTSATLLQVAVTFPTQIRSDYPDVVAGSVDGTFNGTKVRFYLRNQSTGAVQQFDGNITPNTASQTFTIGSSGGTSLGVVSPPTAADSFGLFKFDSASYTLTPIAGASVFSSSTYTLAIAIVWENAVTYISHDPTLGCIYEATDSFAGLFANQRYFGAPVDNLTSLRSSVDPTTVTNRQLRLVNDVGGYAELYRYGSADSGTDDGTATSALTTANGLPGRWRSLNRSGSGSGAGLRYKFDNATTATPASGRVRLNNADPASATAIYISETDRTNFNVASILGQLTTGSLILLSSDLDGTVYRWYGYTSQVDNGSDRTITVSHIAGGGTFTTGGNVSIGLVIKGTPGSPGSTGPAGSPSGLSYTFSNATSGAPSGGALQLNNATPGSATSIRLSETDRFTGNTANLLGALTTSSLLQLVSEADKSIYHWYTYTSQVDNGGDLTLTVAYLFGNGTLVNGSSVTLGLVVAGAPGTNGAAATIAIGTVTTGSPGSSVAFTNAGTSSAAVFNVTIPRGNPGADGTGTGTVTSFSAGDLSPLFTTSEAAPTTTPALSFSLTAQSANQFFAGPGSGGSAAPTFRALVAADIPALTVAKISDFAEATDDRVAALLVQGSNITLTYDDTANTLTIAATGGGGGGSGGRTQLTANRSYFVHKNIGSDSNDGLTSGTDFANLQKAIDVVSALDLNGYTVTINCRFIGQPSDPVVLKDFVGEGLVRIIGDYSSGAYGNPLNADSMTLASGRGFLEAVNLSSNYELVNMGFSKSSSTSGTYAIRIENASLTMTCTDSGFDLQGSIGNLIYVGAGGILKVRDGSSAGRIVLRGDQASYLTAVNGGSVEHATNFVFSGFSVSNALLVVSKNATVDMSGVTGYNGTSITGLQHTVTRNGVLTRSTASPGGTTGTNDTGGQVI